jgi:hypothetical protein
MNNQKLSKPTEEVLRNLLGFDDDQINLIKENPKQFELAEMMQYLHSKKMVATCV